MDGVLVNFQTGIDKLTLTLGFVLKHKEIERVIIGVDSKNQLSEITNTNLWTSKDSFQQLESMDLGLIEPTRWKTS